MTTFELKHSILQDINALMDDEVAMRRLSRYIRRLRSTTSTKISYMKILHHTQWMNSMPA